MSELPQGLTFQVLDEESLERIHEGSLSILSQTGLRVESSQVCALLKEAGAKVEEEQQVVRLSEDIVMGALESVPKDILLQGRNGETLPLSEGEHYHLAGAYMIKMLDSKTSKVRDSTRQDVADCARLADALPSIRGMCPQVVALDVPSDLQDLYTLEAMILNTTKHCLAAPMSLEGARIWTDLGEILCEGEDLSKKPILSFTVSTTSPLQLDRESAQILVHCVKAGIPFITLPCPMAGGTSPFTLAGTITVQNAEALFLLTLSQVVRAETPIIYGAVGAILDMRTGSVSMGSPEFPLFSAATAALARFYRLPSYAPIMTNSTSSDVQAGAEKMLAFVGGIAGGLTLTIGAGSLSNATVASHEQMIIDHALLQAAQRFFQGIRVNEETLALDVIARVGHGGSYLTDEHTLKFLRSGEHHFSEIHDFPGPRAGEKDMRCRAKQEPQRLLSEHTPGVPAKIAERVKEYVREKEKELKQKR